MAPVQSNRGKTLAPDAAAVIQDAPATLLGHAGQESVLPFTANSRWLIRALHILFLCLGAQKPAARKTKVNCPG